MKLNQANLVKLKDGNILDMDVYVLIIIVLTSLPHFSKRPHFRNFMFCIFYRTFPSALHAFSPIFTSSQCASHKYKTHHLILKMPDALTIAKITYALHIDWYFSHKTCNEHYHE